MNYRKKPAKPLPPLIHKTSAQAESSADAFVAANEANNVRKQSRFVFKPEVLDRVGVSYVTIWQWMREGKFPCSREVGGKVAWLESEIDEWMATRPLRKYKNAEAM